MLCVCDCVHCGLSVCVCGYVHGCICVCGGLTPQVNEVRWDDEEDEYVLHPVEEQATKELLRGEVEDTKLHQTPKFTSHHTAIHLPRIRMYTMEGEVGGDCGNAGAGD